MSNAPVRMNRERQRVIANMLHQAMDAVDLEEDERGLMIDVFADIMADLNELRPAGFLLFFKDRPGGAFANL
jgi:hypothetical protein